MPALAQALALLVVLAAGARAEPLRFLDCGECPAAGPGVDLATEATGPLAPASEAGAGAAAGGPGHWSRGYGDSGPGRWSRGYGEGKPRGAGEGRALPETCSLGWQGPVCWCSF